MRALTRACAFLLLAVVATGCVAADTSPVVDTAAEEQAIRAVDARMMAAAQARDAAGFAAVFAPDGKMLFPNLDAVVGRDAIRAQSENDFQTPGFTVSWEADEYHVAGSGDLAVSTGTYELSFTTPDGPFQDRGKFMTFWRKVDGQWMVGADIINTSLPMEGM